MVLGKLPVLGHPTHLDYSRASAYCACSRCRWRLFGHFFLSSIISLLSPSLREKAPYRLKYCLKGLLNPEQPTNLFLNSLITKKQTTKFLSSNSQNMLSPSYIILRIQRLEGKHVDLDEMANFEPPHKDLRCLRIQLFSSLVLNP